MANSNVLVPTDLIPDDAPLLGKGKAKAVIVNKKGSAKFKSNDSSKYMDLQVDVNLSALASSGPGFIGPSTAVYGIASKDGNATFVPTGGLQAIYQVVWKSSQTAGMTIEYVAFPAQ